MSRTTLINKKSVNLSRSTDWDFGTFKKPLPPPPKRFKTDEKLIGNPGGKKHPEENTSFGSLSNQQQ